MSEIGNKRWKTVAITPELLVELAKSKSLIVPHSKHPLAVSADIPQDAKLHHSYYDQTFDTFVSVLEHESFSDVAEGAAIPGIPVTITEVQA